MPKAKTIAKVLLYAVGSFALALVITILLHRSSMKVVAQWKQPPDITYDGWGPYYMSVVERDLDWGGFPFGIERNYIIYTGREAGAPFYGHWVKYSFYPSPDSLEQFLRKAKVEWTTEGVTLELPSGHRLFIPKKMFIGGR